MSKTDFGRLVFPPKEAFDIAATARMTAAAIYAEHPQRDVLGVSAWADALAGRDDVPDTYMRRKSWFEALLAVAGIEEESVGIADLKTEILIRWADPTTTPKRWHHAMTRVEFGWMRDRNAWNQTRREAWKAAKAALPAMMMNRSPSAEIQAEIDRVALGPLLPHETRELVEREIYFTLRSVRRSG